ncbi:MAG: hypothetical protein M3O31_02085 [Acidobacteriota bacterium]|nr:hypothetical protein [Acidobacteriota bacterium]
MIIDSFECWRLNSSAVAKVFRKGQRQGVEGGATLDKSIHDLSVSHALIASGKPAVIEPTVIRAVPLCFLPCIEGDVKSLLNTVNLSWEGYLGGSDMPADGASFFEVNWNLGNRVIHAKYHASWVGVTKHEELCKKRGIASMPSRFYEEIAKSSWFHQEALDLGYTEEDARLMVVSGSLDGKEVRLLANFLSRPNISPWLYDLTNHARIETPVRRYRENALARVFEIVIAGCAAPAAVNYLDFDSALISHSLMFEAHRLLILSLGQGPKEFELGEDILGGIIEISPR